MKKCLLFLALAGVLTASPAAAGSVNCPNWLTGRLPTPGVECWAPLVTYRENVALMTDDPPVYVTKIQLLAEAPHFFDTRAELEAYIQSVLVVRGFWLDHPTRCDNNGTKCLLVPPSAFDHVELRQIIDRVEGTK